MISVNFVPVSSKLEMSTRYALHNVPNLAEGREIGGMADTEELDNLMDK